MTGKKLINENTIEEMDRAHGNLVGFAVGLLGFGTVIAVLNGLIIPGLILVAVIVFILKIKKKRGKLHAYFIERPLTSTRCSSGTDSDGYTTWEYFFVFDDKQFRVSAQRYDAAREGAMYYVMYDAYDNKIRECFETGLYELAPTLDIREIQ